VDVASRHAGQGRGRAGSRAAIPVKQRLLIGQGVGGLRVDRTTGNGAASLIVLGVEVDEVIVA